jgi:hypothetical protein
VVEGGWSVSVDGGSNLSMSAEDTARRASALIVEGRSKRMLHHEAEDSADCNSAICGLSHDGRDGNANSKEQKAGNFASAYTR